jgi:hypothetical protein
MKEKTVNQDMKISLAVGLATTAMQFPLPGQGTKSMSDIVREAFDAVDNLDKADAAPGTHPPQTDPNVPLLPGQVYATQYEPAVSVRKSLANREHIISMIDGKPYKTLRRHLGTHGLTPDQYRERYGLKPDYPMVAEAYSETRRAMAKKIGLGTKQNKGQAPA